jgi:hypothetical protein
MTKVAFAQNGFVDFYPHSDLLEPCTCAECCMDEAHGYVPSCGVCGKPLRNYGLCTDCVNTSAGEQYKLTH